MMSRLRQVEPMQNLSHFESRARKLGGSKPRRLQESIQARVESLHSLASGIVAAADDLEGLAYQILAYPIEASVIENPTDFYKLVRNYEIFLIQRALKRTGGSQAKAAALLNLKTTTLNSKIKSYEIAIS